MKPIPYTRHHVTAEDIRAVNDVLVTDFLTTGPRAAEFEEKFAAYVGAKYAVAVANGTAALHLSAVALGVDASTNVITTPITFTASANCIRYCGGNVFFADIDPETYLLDIHKVRELIESKPTGFFDGIIPVDMAGYPVNLEEYKSLCDEYGLWMIEDACHSPGAWFTNSNSEKAMCGNGAYADLSIFSFHPAKHIACGEGGMVTTNNEELYKRVKLIRTHGITKEAHLLEQNHGGWYYEMQILGYNYRIPDILCALGISQLSRAPEGLERRKEIADRYREAFKDSPISYPQVPDNINHAYHLFVIKVVNRKELFDYLTAHKIMVQVHYIPVHTLPYYRKIDSAISMPISEEYYSQCLSLPMYPSLTVDQQEYVIEHVKYIVDK